MLEYYFQLGTPPNKKTDWILQLSWEDGMTQNDGIESSKGFYGGKPPRKMYPRFLSW